MLRERNRGAVCENQLDKSVSSSGGIYLLVLLVVELLVPEDLEEGSANEEGGDGVHPLRLEGAAVQKLVAAGKGEALHLK